LAEYEQDEDGFHFAMLDPYSIEALDFEVIATLSGLRTVEADNRVTVRH
jgi:hypothetical protein